jgi:hypothetical protein
MNEQEVAKLVRDHYGPTAEFKSADYKSILQIILVNHPLAFGGLKDVIEKQYIDKPMGDKVYRDYRITEDKIYFIYSNNVVMSPSMVSDENIEGPMKGQFNEDDYYLLMKKLLKY